MLIIHFYERTDKMRLIYADYNPQTNSIDVTTFENYILRIDCNKAEDGLRTTPCSQNSLNALAIDEPLDYARLALDGEMQAWVDAIDSLEVWLLLINDFKKSRIGMVKEKHDSLFSLSFRTTAMWFFF